MQQELTVNGNPVTHIVISNDNYYTNRKVSVLREMDWGLVEIEFLNGNKAACEPSQLQIITDQE